MNNDLETTLARLEAATGPDRELDIAIWRNVMGGHPVAFPMPWEYRYTASIDAALTLVPEGGSFQMLGKRTMPEMGGYDWYAEVWYPGRTAHRGKGRTTALAIVEAALKARLTAPKRVLTTTPHTSR